jgi:hypothetical protein
MKITEINVSDNTVIEREATAEEAAQIKKDQDAAKAAKEAADAALADKAIAKAALLERLGISADEARLLLS